MSRPFRLRATTATIAAAALTATLFTAPAAHAISNGTVTDAGVARHLAKIDIGDSVTCSGYVLNHRWIATSAACFSPNPSQPTTPEAGAPYADTTATIGEHTSTITRIVPRQDRDLALARLGTPLTGDTPVPTATVAPAVGQTVQASGHGRTADRWVPDQPHTGDFAVESVTTTALNLQGVADGTSICKGDAGGPILHNGALTAIAGGSHQAGCIGETTEQTGAIAARVDDLLDWIMSHITDLQATPAAKHAIHLTWYAEAPVTNYRIYAAHTENVAITPDNLIGETTNQYFTHTSLPEGETWYYRVRTFDSEHNPIATSATVKADSPDAPGSGTDFNGDGIDDIAALDGGPVHVGLFTRPFTAPSQWAGDVADAGATAYPGDFNGDGKDDLVTFTDAGGPVHVSLSTGDAFAPRELWHAHWGNDGDVSRTGDVNGDGYTDILNFTRGDTADVWVALSDGETFGPAQQWHTSFAPGNSTPAVGDFTGDGQDDIVSFNTNGNVHVSYSDGTQFTQTNWLWHDNFTTATGHTPAVGDFNNDNLADIVNFERGTNGRVDIAYNTGDGFGAKQLFHDQFGRNQEWPGVGDFTGDGKDDLILFTRENTGNVWMAPTNGTIDEGHWLTGFATSPQRPLPVGQR